MNDAIRQWSDLRPNERLLLGDAAIVLGALLAGWLAGAIVRRAIVSHGLDRYFRMPWIQGETVSAAPVNRGKSVVRVSIVTSLAVWACRLFVWAAGLYAIASQHGWRAAPEVLHAMTTGAQGGIVLIAALLACGWIAHVVYGLFQTPWLKQELDALLANASGSSGSFSETAARAACIGVYIAFLLLVPVALSGLFGLKAFAGLVNPAWLMLSRLLTAMAAFALGYLGLAWVRSQSKLARGENPRHAEIEYYVGLGIMVTTTLAALCLLIGISNGVSAVAIIGIVALIVSFCWPVRVYLKDLWAGMLLRLQSVTTVTIEGVVMTVKSTAAIITTLDANGDEVTRPNAEVLAAVLRSARKRVES